MLKAIFPKKCITCNKQTNKYICFSCIQQIKPKYQTEKNIPPFKKGIYFFNYNSPTIKKLLNAIKKDNHEKLSLWLSAELSKTIFSLKYDAIIPIPLHKKRMKKRSFNQVSLIFHKLIEKNNQLFLPILLRKKNTPPLYNQNSIQRKIILKNSFKINPVFDLQWLKNKNIAIIDDIISTKSTSTEAYNTLIPYKISSCDIISFARPI